MRWRKQGLVFAPNGRRPWLRSHASLPLAHLRADGAIRVYFASRDAENRSHVAWVDLDSDRWSVQALAEQPALAPGPLGHFDDFGVYPASLVERHGELWLYYIGWNPGVRPPLFYATIGLAVSHDGGDTFERASAVPVLGRGEHDPCLVTSPCVLRDGDGWRMWYVSGFRWEADEDGLRSYYDVKHASSADGLSWERDGRACIPLGPGERNIARPCVLRGEDGYRMWYARNEGGGYRIGYAVSDDGFVWVRRDADAGIDLSPGGWDSEAQAYPWVFRLRGRLWMLYNGNGYGRDGFGLAVAED